LTKLEKPSGTSPTSPIFSSFTYSSVIRYALDGRNPNTYTGILWCFGKHDRAWGPQRQVFDLVRYNMTSENTRRKINLPAYKAWVESCEKNGGGQLKMF